jgi:DNA polymerase
LRQELSKSSVKKYASIDFFPNRTHNNFLKFFRFFFNKNARNTPSIPALFCFQKIRKNFQKFIGSGLERSLMKNVVCKDGRARGLFQFYGAGRTGRFAGRLIQLQNLPQNHMDLLECARKFIEKNDFETLKLLFDSIPSVLSELIRTAFVPKLGRKFIVADFSAIEARVIAWLANEKWKMDVFAGDGKIYEATAAKMFGVPIESVTKGSDIRQKAKQTELACGYGGSVGALKAMGALEMGIREDELMPLVNARRTANPNIVRLWQEIEKEAETAVKKRVLTETYGIKFECKSGILFVLLPGGRTLSYVKPRIEINRFGKASLAYEGVNSVKKWDRIETFGGKLVENITQAIARDILCQAMKKLDKNGYEIVMHCHDEVVIEATEETDVKEICDLMCESHGFAGLILRAEGFECKFYKKD